ncbi:MAG TPA: site-2 protease family protein [Clostridia bacterium]|nr:site-2 protease family protein [Clostridia bacterium]
MTLQHVDIFFQIVAFLFAISIHESAHAWMASRCGDPTARMLGRVTLNPLRHIDPIGTVVLPALAMISGFPVIGWAKPTPVDPRNFRNPVRDDVLTSVAGPVSNFIVVLGSVAALAAISLTSASGNAVVKNLSSGFLTDVNGLMPLTLMVYEFMQINILLGIFNLIPVPPLDGSHVLRHLLPESIRNAYDRVGMLGIIVLMLFGGRFLGKLLFPVVSFFNAILAKL